MLQGVPVEIDAEGHAAHVRSLIDQGLLSHSFELQWEPMGLDPFQVISPL